MKALQWIRPLLAVALLLTAVVTVSPARAQADSCKGLLPSRLEEGGLGRPMPGVEPELIYPDGGASGPATMPSETVFEIVYGPECDGEAVWWLVSFDGVNAMVAEATADSYALVPVPELGEVYEDESIVFEYPSSWLIQPLEGDIIALFAEGSSGVAPGEFVIALYPDTHLVPSLTDAEGTPTELLEIDAAAGAQQGVPYGTPITAQQGGRELAYTYAQLESFNMNSMVIIVDLGNGQSAMMVAMTMPDEIAIAEALAVAVTYSMHAPGVELTTSGSTTGDEGGINLDAVGDILGQSSSSSGTTGGETDIYTSADGSFSFTYPAGWIVEVWEGNTLVMVNDPAVFDAADLDGLAPGQVVVIIYPTVADIPDYPDAVGPDTTASTIVSYYAAMGMATGYMQEGAMGMFTVEGRDVATSLAHAAGHDRLVISADNGQGDFVTLVAFGASGDLQQFQDTLVALAASVNMP